MSHDATSGHIEVSPGLAIDRVGRVVELRQAFQTVDLASWLEQSGQAKAAPQLCVDVHVRFEVELDSHALIDQWPLLEDVEWTGRLRDGGQRRRLRLGGIHRHSSTIWWGSAPGEQRRLAAPCAGPSPERRAASTTPSPVRTPQGVADPTAAFLARVTVGVTTVAGAPRRISEPVLIDNHSRSSRSTNACAGWARPATDAMVHADSRAPDRGPEPGGPHRA